MASKYSCCRRSNNESLNHLLVQSTVATGVWGHFARILCKPTHHQTVQHMTKAWLHGMKGNSHMVQAIQITIFGGLWEILKSRCRHRFDNQPMNHLDIITRTYGHLNETCRLILRTDTNNTWENTTLDAFRIPSFRGPTSRGKWVAWRKPGGRRW